MLLSMFLRRVSALAPLLFFTHLACEERPRGTGGSAPSGPAIGNFAKAKPKPVAATPPGEPAPESANLEPPDLGGPVRPLTERFRLGPIDDVGPAGPMSATPDGVLFVSRENRLYLAARDGSDGFVALQAPRELFVRYGRGPAVGKEYAYYITSDGQLCRAHLQTGEVEALASDAQAGTRVSVVRAADRDVVGYIARHDEEALAYLWSEGPRGKPAEVVRLSPEGSEATSITLVPTKPHPEAVLLEGRSGMSPVHVRRLLVTARKITPEPDQVVWVGPGSHSLTELVSLRTSDDRVMSLLATAKDVTHFGLAQLNLEVDSRQAIDPVWRPYPNGLDPAPVAASRFCGRDFALYALPTHEKPRAPQDLVLAPIASGQLGAEEVLAHSRAFNDISVAATPDGAIIAWTADHRTWAMALGCKAAK